MTSGGGGARAVFLLVSHLAANPLGLVPKYARKRGAGVPMLPSPTTIDVFSHAILIAVAYPPAFHALEARENVKLAIWDTAIRTQTAEDNHSFTHYLASHGCATSTVGSRAAEHSGWHRDGRVRMAGRRCTGRRTVEILAQYLSPTPIALGVVRPTNCSFQRKCITKSLVTARARATIASAKDDNHVARRITCAPSHKHC